MVLALEVTGNKVECPECGWPVSRVTRNDLEKVAARHMQRRVRRHKKTGQPIVYVTKVVCPASLKEL